MFNVFYKSTSQIVAEIDHRQINKLIVILYTKNRRAIYHLQANLIKRPVRLRCSNYIKSEVYEYYLRVYEYDPDIELSFRLKTSCFIDEMQHRFVLYIKNVYDDVVVELDVVFDDEAESL